MEADRFNLLDEEFIIAIYKDGTTKSISLSRVFQDAQQILSLKGQTPFAETVTIRLLLAVLYRVYQPKTENDWFDIWDTPLDVERILGYLNAHRDRFDLFHPDAPFYQIPNGEYEKDDTPRNLSALFLDASFAPDKKTAVYSSYNTKGLDSTTAADGARRIIEVQNYCVGSKASILSGDPRKKKRGYREPGWLSRGLVATLVGSTLEETLKLNLTPYSALDPELDPELDLPVWERLPQGVAPEGLHGDLDESFAPTGPASLFTYQPARITLDHDGDTVTAAVVGIGDRLTRRNKQHIEPMMPWQSKEEKDGEVVWNPYKPATPTSAWDLLNTLAATTTFKGRTRQAPKNITFIRGVMGEIEEDLEIPEVRIKVTTVFYGAQDAIIDSTTETTTAMPSNIFAANDPKILDTALYAVSIAQEYIYYYQKFLSEVSALHTGTTAAPTKRNVRLALLDKCEELFYSWSEGLNDENLSRKITEWDKDISRIITRHIEKEVNTLAPTLIRQKAQKTTEKGEIINIFTLSNKYHAIIFKKVRDREMIHED